MTYGQLFVILNPNVKVVENGTCVWIYFDSANHDTLRVEWWNKEIPDEALKAQEPRVMTLEEVKGMKRFTICAVELHSKIIKNTFNAEYGGISMLGTENYLYFGLYRNTNQYIRSEGGYGKTWRCWTSRPTEEQREATPWD